MEYKPDFIGTVINYSNNVLSVSDDANPDDDISTLSLSHFITIFELAINMNSLYQAWPKYKGHVWSPVCHVMLVI